MKKILATFICEIVFLTATGCSKSDNISAPNISEFGIEMSEEDLITAISEKSDQTIDKDEFGEKYLINGNSNDTIRLGVEEDKITHLTVSCSGATEDKANSVERASEYFKSVISVLYPDADSAEINDLLKQIRYEEADNDLSPKGHLFNDIYIIYYTSFGAKGLTFSNSKVTIAYWRIESIEYYNK